MHLRGVVRAWSRWAVRSGWNIQGQGGSHMQYVAHGSKAAQAFCLNPLGPRAIIYYFMWSGLLVRLR